MKKISKYFNALGALVLMILAFATASVEGQKKKPAAQTIKTAATKSKSATGAVKVPEEEQSPQEQAAPAAKSSRTRICVAAPKTNLMPSETAPESLRNSLVKYLSGPAAEIVPLDAMVAVQQRAEAEEKGCAFYLAVSVMKKKSGGGEGFGDLLKKGSSAAPLLDNLGAGKTATSVSNVARKSQTKLTTAGDLAAGIKAKDEVTLEYNLSAAQSNSTAASGKIKAKASKDGEDVLSGLLEKSVNDILTAAMKK